MSAATGLHLEKRASLNDEADSFMFKNPIKPTMNLSKSIVC